MALSPAYSVSGSAQRYKKTLVVDAVQPNPGVDPNTEYEYFEGIATLVPTAAGTAVTLAINNLAGSLIDDTYVGPTRSIYINQVRVSVNGATPVATTGTLVRLQDTAAVAALTYAVAGLTANSMQSDLGANITQGAVMLAGTRKLATGKGIQVQADANFGSGSNIQIWVSGTIK